MALDLSPWVGMSRERFREWANDQARINRLRHDRTYFLQSGWADEVSERRPRPTPQPEARAPRGFQVVA